jgi:CheY-like chemotaxis protein
LSNILIIEDEPNTARLADKLLKRAGHQTRIAGDGESGLELANEAPPDLILADFGLPDMDGLAMVSQMRNRAPLALVPIIAFTAYPRNTVTQISAAYGCRGVISKPINTRTFVQEIETYIAKA